MITQKDQWEVEEKVRDTLRILKREAYFDKIDIVWSNKMTRAAGKASYEKPDKFTIHISYELYDRADANQRETVIIHETCHIVNFIEKRWCGHGYEWQFLMVQCKQVPKRCHDIKVIVNRPFTYTCSCGHKYGLSPIRVNKMKKGHNYRCAICHTRLELEKVVNREEEERRAKMIEECKKLGLF